MEELNVLFLGGGKRVSLAEYFINKGKDKGFKVNIYSYELTNQVPISSVAEVIVGLKWDDNSILDHLSNIVKDNKIKIILSFVDQAIEIASKLKEKVKHTFIPCCNQNMCQIMYDKKMAYEWFNINNIPTPKTFNQITNHFPYILKPRKGSASKGIVILYNKEELKKINDIHAYVIQEYISNKTEYTVDCYVSSNNDIISIVPRVRLEVAGGEVVNTLTCRNERIIELSKIILQTGNFKGPITIQFIKNNDINELYVMEINPRLGGGVIASIEAGADVVSFIIEDYMGLPLVYMDQWQENLLMTRYFKEVFFICK